MPQVNDKVLHFITFFLLTLTFYWILDASRRRARNITLIAVTLCLSVGSEALQGILPNGRQFDPLDIVANLVGSLGALILCSVYHKRMLDRKQKRKMEGYGLVPEQEGDVELGEGGGSQQDLGIENNATVKSMHDEHENEEGEEAWDELGGGESTEGEGDKMTPSSGSAAE